MEKQLRGPELSLAWGGRRMAGMEDGEREAKSNAHVSPRVSRAAFPSSSTTGPAE